MTCRLLPLRGFSRLRFPHFQFSIFNFQLLKFSILNFQLTRQEGGNWLRRAAIVRRTIISIEKRRPFLFPIPRRGFIKSDEMEALRAIGDTGGYPVFLLILFPYGEAKPGDANRSEVCYSDLRQRIQRVQRNKTGKSEIK
jgi:hypothetical protein